MRPSILISSALSIIPLISGKVIPEKTYCPPRPAHEIEQTAIWNNFVYELYVQKNVSHAFLTHVDPSYIQHNPFALSGRQVAIDFLTSLWPTVNITIMHSGFANNIGWIHYRQAATGEFPVALVDVLRFDGTCIMEHWDVIQSWSPNYTNPLALF